MTVATSDHDEGSTLDLFAAEAAPGAGGLPRIVGALKDEDSTSLFPSEHVTSDVTSDHEELTAPALDEFATEADVPPGITAAPTDEDSESLFPAECVTPVGAIPLAPPIEPVIVGPVPRHDVPWMEVPFASAAGSESPPRELPRGQWRGAAASIAIAVLMFAGLLGTLVLDRQAVPLPAAPVTSPTRLRPLPAQPTADRPTESVTRTTAATPSPPRSDADDAELSLAAATRTTAQDRAAAVAGARTTQPRGPASRPSVPPPSASAPASRAEPMPTANVPIVNVPTVDVPTKTPAAAELTGAGSTTAGVAAPAAIAVPPPDPAPSPGAVETEAVGSILTRYRSAFSALDASAVEAFWPSVNSKALANAFGQLEAQSLDFGTCQIDVQGARAQAVCSGWVSFVPKVGGNRRRVEARQWTFHLVRPSTTWLIARVDAR